MLLEMGTIFTIAAGLLFLGLACLSKPTDECMATCKGEQNVAALCWIRCATSSTGRLEADVRPLDPSPKISERRE